MKQESKTPKKPLIFYYLIAMLVLLLLNALVFPAVLQRWSSPLCCLPGSRRFPTISFFLW